MSDRFFYPLAALIALAMIGLALVWPQGLGDRSPAPFGHPVAAPPATAKPSALLVAHPSRLAARPKTQAH